jgi:hypothetical protein
MRRLKWTVALAAMVVAVGAPVGHASFQPDRVACSSGYYKNVDGHCVHRPVHATKAPAGATAKCRDGTYSFSRHASGTCSGHGGVAVWIHHP